MIATIYETATGIISRTVVADADSVILQVGASESYIEGDYSSNKYTIVNGVAVENDSPVEDTTAVFVRNTRDLLLAKTDWTQLPDVSEETKLKYQAYRQALRDITQQEGFPHTIDWPEVN